MALPANQTVNEATPVQQQGGQNQEASAALILGLRAGSSQAWARLYDQLAPGVHRFACSCLSGDVEAAHDVVVDTLADAARRISRFDPQRSSLSAWVYGIARRVVQTELRRRARRKSVPAWAQVSFGDLPELTGGEDLGSRSAARLDAQRRIREATDLLSEAEMELLSLSSIEGLSVREIGRATERSEQATRCLLTRARQKARRTVIEGTLVVGATRWSEESGGFYPYSHVFSGSEDRLVGDEFGISCEFSPASDDIAYCLHGPGVQEWPPVSGHIWRAKRDGSGAVNLSEAVGLRGINFYPRWSPDGTLIAFTHWDEPGAELSGPGEAWVMKADGSEAQRLAPEGTLLISRLTWSRDGSCLVFKMANASQHALPTSVDLWGRHVRLVPVPDPWGDWSAHGPRTALTRLVRGKAGGEPGHWRQLLVAEADGSAPRVLVEQFIADAAVDACRPPEGTPEAAPTFDWRALVLSWAGPVAPRWSPAGDKIAFLAALPLDPTGMAYNLQVDAWIYDLVTRRLTKITNEPQLQHSLSWR